MNSEINNMLKAFSLRLSAILFVVLLSASLLSCSRSNNNNNGYSGDTTGTDSGRMATAEPSNGDSAKEGKNMAGIMSDMQNDMKNMKMSGNMDMDMADMMIRYHEAGKDLADVEIDNGKDQHVIDMAKKMKDVSNNEIDRLKQLKSNISDNSSNNSGTNSGNNSSNNSKSGSSSSMMSSNMMSPLNDMMTKMKNEKMTGDPDQDFVRTMIIHHQYGVKLANMEAKMGKSSGMKDVARTMITGDQRDIKDMQQWLDSRKMSSNMKNNKMKK